MKNTIPEQLRTDAWGIDNGYEDAMHAWHDTPQSTTDAILVSMEAEPGQTRPAPYTEPVFIVQGTSTGLSQPADLHLEDGTTLALSRTIPEDVPLGYHRLLTADQLSRPCIVIPRSCYLPEGLRTWGWAVQLYSARSANSWGMGDLADLRTLAHWSAQQGAGFLLMNPISAVTPLPGQQPSPYFPTTRRFRNPIYLRIEEIPGADDASIDLASLARAGRELNSNKHIDRDAVFRIKDDALRKIWAKVKKTGQHRPYVDRCSESLREFATFCVLAEHHGHDWRRWPAEFQNPNTSAVKRFADENASSVEYHCWLQGLIEDQLQRASVELRVMQDLPIGVDPGGADAWAWQEYLATSVSVGAPPDVYNTDGQNWGLPPFVPHKLRAAGYKPFIETIRAAMQHAGGLRIDHVMGMFRLFWIPYGAHPSQGTFVRYAFQELLGIIALESVRARAFVVGEDLGTVEPGVREALQERKILSYRVLWFEDEPPNTYPELSLAAVTTHDLPTIAGLWTGADIEAEYSVGKSPNVEAVNAIKARLAEMTRASEGADAVSVIQKTHELLAEAPSVVVTATLEDAIAVEERPNMPGTVDQWPNWSIALPKTIEEIVQAPLPNRIAKILNDRSRAAE